MQHSEKQGCLYCRKCKLQAPCSYCRDDGVFKFSEEHVESKRCHMSACYECFCCEGERGILPSLRQNGLLGCADDEFQCCDVYCD